MKILKVKPGDLKIDERYLFSFPSDTVNPQHFSIQYPGIPQIIIDGSLNIIFGLENYHTLRKKVFKKEEGFKIEVLQVNMKEKDALFLAYNLKEKLLQINTYEKLVFLKKIISLTKKEEIYQRTRLDININDELIAKLDLLISELFKDSLIKEKFCLKIALGICRFKREEDQKELINLFKMVPFSRSRGLSILEMLEELLFREKKSLDYILRSIELTGKIEKEPSPQYIYEEIFRYRYPKYSAQKVQWTKQMEALKIPAHINVSHVPFFEKKKIELKVNLQDYNELIDFMAKIKK